MSTNKTDGSLSGELPWTRSCFVCGQDNPRGLRLRCRLEAGVVVIDYTPCESDLGWRHIVHGGITMTLLDEVMTWSAIIAARRPCVAAELTVRLKEPVAVGVALRIEGRVVTRGKRLLATAGAVLNTGGRVAVEATGKYVPMQAQTRMPEGSHGSIAADFVTGPGSLKPEQLMDFLATAG